MIRTDMTRQDARHPDKRRRHQGRASCEVAGRRFEAEGPAPIYKLATLLWRIGRRLDGVLQASSASRSTSFRANIPLQSRGRFFH